MNLNGKYCTLRPITTEDAPVTHKWRVSNRASLLNKGALDVDGQAKWIASRLATPGEYNFIIEVDRAPVGMIAIVDIQDKLKMAETGRFLIGEPEICQGIPVACDSLICHYDFAFSVLNLDFLYGNIHPSNKKMINFHKYTGAKVSKSVESENGFIKFKNNYINIQIDRNCYFNSVRKKLINLMGLV